MTDRLSIEYGCNIPESLVEALRDEASDLNAEALRRYLEKSWIFSDEDCEAMLPALRKRETE